jgi:ribosome-associated protein
MKKRAGKASGPRSRPAMKSSHEKVLEGGAGARKARAKAPRARLPSSRVRPPARAPREPSSTWSVASDTARERATAIAVAALDKKAVGVEILDVAGKVDYADFLVIMTGRSDRHTQALAQGIEEALKRKGVRAMAIEGLPHGTWVLMDFGDVVVHVFLDETRQLYDIDGLWLDARRLPVPAVAPGATE